jgi:hypothetical protein
MDCQGPTVAMGEATATLIYETEAVIYAFFLTAPGTVTRGEHLAKPPQYSRARSISIPESDPPPRIPYALDATGDGALHSISSSLKFDFSIRVFAPLASQLVNSRFATARKIANSRREKQNFNELLGRAVPRDDTRKADRSRSERWRGMAFRFRSQSPNPIVLCIPAAARPTPVPTGTSPQGVRPNATLAVPNSGRIYPDASAAARCPAR